MLPGQAQQGKADLRQLAVVAKESRVQRRPRQRAQHRHRLRRQLLPQSGGETGRDAGDQLVQGRTGQREAGPEKGGVNAIIARQRAAGGKHRQAFGAD